MFYFVFLFRSFLGCAGDDRLLGGTLVELCKTDFKPEGEFRQIPEKSPWLSPSELPLAGYLPSTKFFNSHQKNLLK